MDPATYLPLAASGLLWLFGARMGRWLPPATAVWLLSLAALVTALATGFVLSIAGFDVLVQVPGVAAFGHWSPQELRMSGTVPVAAGVLAGVTVLVLLASSLHRVAHAVRDLATATILCQRLGPSAGRLVVVDAPRADAFALPGFSGKVVVTRAMMKALTADERRVLLAHEMAHLRHRHHFYIEIAELAASANPFLRPLAPAVRTAAERAADEMAAAEVADRPLAARALARAGLARAATRSATCSAMPAAALAAVEASVADRARALLAPPPRSRPALVAAVAVMMLLTTASTAWTAHTTEHRFEQAHTLTATEQ
ncbi:MAG: M56 family metallopeptidase [Nocardioidaceae bacterium]